MQEFWVILSNGDLISHLGFWSYLLVAVLTFLEGPAVTLVAATIAGAGNLNPWLVFLAAGAGNFTADIGWYTLGYLGQFDTLKRYMPGLTRFDLQINRLQQDIHQNAIRRLLFTKLSMNWATIPTIVTAGMARVSWFRLLPIGLMAEVIWTGALVLAGFYLGNYLSSLKLSLEILAVVGGIISVITIVLAIKKFIAPAKFDPNLVLPSGDNQ
jgi:membrane protein DedA with SNARE-associated domain